MDMCWRLLSNAAIGPREKAPTGLERREWLPPNSAIILGGPSG